MKNTKSLKIFITISRGGLVRNILRTGLLDMLLAKNICVIILLPGKVLPYFKDEFNHPNIILEELPDKIYSKFRKFFIILFNGLVYTSTEYRKLKYGGANKKPSNKIIFWLKHTVFSIISKIKILKYIARFIEFNLFIDKDYDYLFEKYKPDLVFGSAIYAKIDSVCIKAAKRFSVPSLSMPKSWDTVGRLFFRAPSDRIILSNEFMRDWVASEQLFKPENIFVSGFPQFDIYKQKQNFLTKTEFCKKTKLNPEKPTILYASEGLWTYWDDYYIEDLINNHKILDKYNLILRPHFSNLRERKYHRFKKYNDLYIDDENVRITDMFVDGWDPTKDNMDWMSEVINISDVVVTFHTTFVLDVFALDKPVINVYYNPSQEYQIKNNYNLAPIEEIYKCVHYDAVLAEKGVALAKNGRDIMRWIEKYLQDSSLLKQERKNTIDKLCHKIDGQATARIFKSIMDNLR